MSCPVMPCPLTLVSQKTYPCEGVGVRLPCRGMARQTLSCHTYARYRPLILNRVPFRALRAIMRGALSFIALEVNGMRILLVSAEVDPFAKVGGLADVVGSMPKSLKQIGEDVRIMMPHYGFLDVQRFQIEPLFQFSFTRRTGTVDVQVSQAVHNGVTVYFVRAPWYFGVESSVYGDWNYDMPRFVFFNQAVIEVVAQLMQRHEWSPDVIHANDWHTGLLPFLVDERRKVDAAWAGVGTMMSIHNMAYQGDNAGGWCWDAGIPARTNSFLTARNLTDNLMAIAIAHSDMITTVSPRYAFEIQFEPAGSGLSNLLRVRTLDLFGILNGIDTDIWNPHTDPMIVEQYDASDFLKQRAANKRQLQIDAGLPVRDDVPIISFVSRLVWQKGFDLAFPALRRLLAEQDVQFIALGAGEQVYNDGLFALGQDFHWKSHAFIGFNATVAQRIYAGCDIFLMPSHYEPCGIGQMLAMRYGALPLVRDTGGLADTVENYDNGAADKGVGFVFDQESVDAVYYTMLWALDTYRNKREAWLRMQQRAMGIDFSWTRSAKAYVDLYKKIGKKRAKAK
jgi:starch synthase